MSSLVNTICEKGSSCLFKSLNCGCHYLKTYKGGCQKFVAKIYCYENNLSYPKSIDSSETMSLLTVLTDIDSALV